MTSGKPARWDPIRVSTAWPALRDTRLVAEPAGSTGPAGGYRDGSALGDGALGERPSGRGITATGARGPAAPGRRPATARASGAAARCRRRQRDAAIRVVETRVVVIAAVLLCVLAVLLAVFA